MRGEGPRTASMAEQPLCWRPFEGTVSE